jgi:NAD(P)-dependent dehydrogenase (short-subunit alcohol dehydrogenase family)
VKRVLVTGGSLGIGKAVAEKLAADGDRLVLVARGREALEETVATLPGTGHEVYALDVSDEDGWQSLDLEELDGLVCAAGVMQPIGPIGSYSIADFRRTLEINLVGTWLAIDRCLPALRRSGGAIVTFGGGGATGPLARFDAYATSKAAVARLTENLASVISPVRINCVAPGFVATRLHEETLAAGREAAGEAFYERTEREIAGGGFPASEAAELVGYLLSDATFTGKIVSAAWDPWRDESFVERLATDGSFGTIRRIDGEFFDTLDRAS